MIVSFFLNELVKCRYMYCCKIYVYDICVCISIINKFISFKIFFYMYNVDIFLYYNNNYYMYC